MAGNAKFEVEIYGNTVQFENSLKGINSAMSSLKGEAAQLRKELRFDPTNVTAMTKLQDNYKQQLEQTKNKATALKKELAGLDSSTPDGQKKFIQLSKAIQDSELKANYLERDIKQLDSSISSGNFKVDLKTDDAENKLGKMKSGFSAFKEIAIGALRQIGASTVSALGNGLKGWVSDAMDTQKAMISLKNTMNFKGNGADFQSVSTSMQKLAKDTNANTEDTLKLATTFIGLGDNAKSAVSKTEALVKANQAFGGTGENLKGVVQAYGQMSAAGKVSAENINQLTDNNTALGSALKSTVMEMNPALKQYGSFAGASEKGAISVEMLDKAMQKLGKAGGGGVTTIGDSWDSFNETLSLALLPTLDALTPVISAIIDKMSGWGEVAGDVLGGIVQYVQFLWESISDSGALDMLSGGFQALGSTIGSIVDIIKNILVSFGILPEKAITADDSIKAITESVLQLSGNFEAIMKNIADFVKGISESEGAMDAIKIAIVALAGAFVALKVINGVLKAFELYNKILKVGTIIQGAFNAIMAINPFVALGIAIAGIVAGLVYFFTQTKTGKAMWQSFIDWFQGAWEGIKTFFAGLGTWFSELWTGIVQIFTTVWQGMLTVVTTVWEGIKSYFSTLITFYSTIFNAIVTVVSTVFTAIGNFALTAFNAIVSFFSPLGQVIGAIFDLVVAVFRLGWELIMALGRGAWQGIQAIWSGLVGFFSPIWNAVSNVVNVVFTAIGNFARSAWSVIVSVFSVVAGWFSGIFNSVRSAVSSVFSAFGSFASSAWGAITGVFSGVAGWFGGVFNGIKGTISGVFSAFGSIAKTGYDAIIGVFNGIGSFFSGIFDGVKNTVDSVLGGISGTIKGITDTINGITGKVKGLFKGSTVTVAREFADLKSRGLVQNSASNSTSNYQNTFNIQAGSQDTTALARAIKREFDLGRA